MDDNHVSCRDDEAGSSLFVRGCCSQVIRLFGKLISRCERAIDRDLDELTI